MGNISSVYKQTGHNDIDHFKQNNDQKLSDQKLIDQKLPDEIINLISEFCDYKALCKLEQTNTYLYNLIEERKYWKSHTLKRFKSKVMIKTEKEQSGSYWKNVYKTLQFGHVKYAIVA